MGWPRISKPPSTDGYLLSSNRTRQRVPPFHVALDELVAVRSSELARDGPEVRTQDTCSVSPPQMLEANEKRGPRGGAKFAINAT